MKTVIEDGKKMTGFVLLCCKYCTFPNVEKKIYQIKIQWPYS